MKYRTTPTRHERLMRDDDFIVSKTDLKGRITYCNRIFQEFAGYPAELLLGAPHNIIRHPDMPRGMFKLIWERLEKGEVVHALVKNMSADGSFYWVFATMTPSVDELGERLGYYSVRRAPSRQAVAVAEELYGRMLAEEKRHQTADQIPASLRVLEAFLQERGMVYEDFVLSI